MAAPVTKFKFSDRTEKSQFSGIEFYNLYKDAEFLQSSENIHRILQQGYELRNLLRKKEPGELVDLGMWLARNSPLLVKKTGKGVELGDFEFTQNRLKGLVAAFVYENRQKFPNIKAEEATQLGLTWDNEDAEKCKFYLSTVAGAEHFEDQFSYWPLLCALRKLEIKKVNNDTVIKIAKKKNTNGNRMSDILGQNYEEVQRLWKFFPDAPDFKTSINQMAMPTELIAVFVKV
ncbi:uncharacterized protein LOC131855031 [Achroia grisella]|uniref:uncharacterized protein LOC131855031 n=1 Tax=Achroia grisella TaxID=688607 RepID=UPI0027D235FB|nr:uncharacterized protein LOC131855031 [Achroia grisella]